MDCRKEEVKRILTSRLFWVLFAGSVAVNLWIIANYRTQASMVKAAAELKNSGIHFVTDENREEIILVLKREEPAGAIVGVRSLVEAIPMMEKQLCGADYASLFIEEFKLSGKAAQLAGNVGRTLEELLVRDRENGTASSLFVPCTNGYFELFTRLLPIACTVEASLAGILLMFCCVNAPYDNRLKEIVYTTKAGRKLNRFQTESALFSIVMFSILLWGITLFFAEAVFRMGSLWQVKVGSMMMLDSFYPVICRFSVSLGVYMLLQVILSVAVTLFFGMTAAISLGKVHKTVPAFFKLAFCCASAATITEIFPRDSVLFFILRFQPVDFIKKAGRWFASGAGFLSVRYYETAFVLCWGTLLLWLLVRHYKHFLTEDI